MHHILNTNHADVFVFQYVLPSPIAKLWYSQHMERFRRPVTDLSMAPVSTKVPAAFIPVHFPNKQVGHDYILLRHIYYGCRFPGVLFAAKTISWVALTHDMLRNIYCR